MSKTLYDMVNYWLEKGIAGFAIGVCLAFASRVKNERVKATSIGAALLSIFKIQSNSYGLAVVP